MRKATTSSFFAGKFSRLKKVPVGTAKRFCAGALSAALVLTGVSVPQKSASAASAKLNKDSVVLYVGGNATAKIKAKNVKKVTYKSKDTSVAKVNKTTGKITAKGAGSTKIVAKTDAGKLKCKVQVYKAIKTLVPDTSAVVLAPGASRTVSVGVKPKKANDTMWEVSTSDKSVAKKQKGNGIKGTFDIIGVSEGTATITVRSTDGGSAPDAKIKVTVTDAYTTSDIPADIDTVPEQNSIAVLTTTALTNEAQDELYVWYAAYDAAGKQIENPAVGWTVSANVTDADGTETEVSLDAEDYRDLSCLVVTAADGGTFSAGDTVSVYGRSMNSDITVLSDVAVGEVRELTDVVFAGILETDAAGTTTNIGNELPLGFESNGNTYRLAFNGMDQTGNIIVNGTEGSWNEEENCGTGTYMYGDAADENSAWDSAATPARIGDITDEEGVAVTPTHSYENGFFDGVYYDTFVINGTEQSEKGGTGVFVIEPNTYAVSYFFDYRVGEVPTLASIELVAPEGTICDGDTGVEIAVNGVYTDGTVVENITTTELAEILGEDAVQVVDVSATKDSTDTVACSVTYNGSKGTITWSDGMAETAIYSATCFDGKDRTITITLEGIPNSIECESLTLNIKDPRRPTSVVESNGTLSTAYTFMPWGEGGGGYIYFKDQYNEYMKKWYVELFYKRAVGAGYTVTDGTGYSGTTWYGMAFVVPANSGDTGSGSTTYVAWWDDTPTSGWAYDENGIWTPGNGVIDVNTKCTISIVKFSTAPSVSSSGSGAYSGSYDTCGSSVTVTRTAEGGSGN